MSNFIKFYKNKRLINDILISTGSIKRRMNDNSFPRRDSRKLNFKPRSISRSINGYKEALKKQAKIINCYINLILN